MIREKQSIYSVKFWYSLISKKDKDTKIELQNWHLPPKYVEMFESVTDIMKELQSKCKFWIIVVTKLEEDQQKRLMPKFNEEENIKIDKQIRDNITYMTRKIKECEDSIKQISYEKVDTPAEERSK